VNNEANGKDKISRYREQGEVESLTPDQGFDEGLAIED
jgi:hypothetical protein